ncbi:hypothetical protein ABT369_50760 [Dactylosporangium sp. NPDC000244]|uniref:hypothetical protein n=1 Tax=Dactylosporangium sp. NPDC000244 TaxID=3154365 RepID=UPI0033253D90
MPISSSAPKGLRVTFRNSAAYAAILLRVSGVMNSGPHMAVLLSAWLVLPC